LPCCVLGSCLAGCLSTAPELTHVIAAQLKGCVSDHKEEEKVGLMYCKAPGKGCASLESAHHGFLSYLTLVVWTQLFLGVGYLILAIIYDGSTVEVCVEVNGRKGCVEAPLPIPFGAVFFRVLIQFGWAFVISYVIYWAMETRNKSFTGLGLLVYFIWAIFVLLNITRTGGMWDLATYFFLFWVLVIGYFILLASVLHTAVFGAVMFLKINPDIAAKLPHKNAQGGTADPKDVNPSVEP